MNGKSVVIMVLPKQVISLAKTSFLSSIVMDASYRAYVCGFFSDVKFEFAKWNVIDCCNHYFTNYVTFDSAPLLLMLNNNVLRPFLRPNKIKWQIRVSYTRLRGMYIPCS